MTTSTMDSSGFSPILHAQVSDEFRLLSAAASKAQEAASRYETHTTGLLKAKSPSSPKDVAEPPYSIANDHLPLNPPSIASDNPGSYQGRHEDANIQDSYNANGGGAKSLNHWKSSELGSGGSSNSVDCIGKSQDNAKLSRNDQSWSNKTFFDFHPHKNSTLVSSGMVSKSRFSASQASPVPLEHTTPITGEGGRARKSLSENSIPPTREFLVQSPHHKIPKTVAEWMNGGEATAFAKSISEPFRAKGTPKPRSSHSQSSTARKIIQGTFDIGTPRQISNTLRTQPPVSDAGTTTSQPEMKLSVQNLNQSITARLNPLPLSPVDNLAFIQVFKDFVFPYIKASIRTYRGRISDDTLRSIGKYVANQVVATAGFRNLIRDCSYKLDEEQKKKIRKVIKSSFNEKAIASITSGNGYQTSEQKLGKSVSNNSENLSGASSTRLSIQALTLSGSSSPHSPLPANSSIVRYEAIPGGSIKNPADGLEQRLANSPIAPKSHESMLGSAEASSDAVIVEKPRSAPLSPTKGFHDVSKQVIPDEAEIPSDTDPSVLDTITVFVSGRVKLPDLVTESEPLPPALPSALKSTRKSKLEDEDQKRNQQVASIDIGESAEQESDLGDLGRKPENEQNLVNITSPQHSVDPELQSEHDKKTLAQLPSEELSSEEDGDQVLASWLKAMPSKEIPDQKRLSRPVHAPRLAQQQSSSAGIRSSTPTLFHADAQNASAGRSAQTSETEDLLTILPEPKQRDLRVHAPRLSHSALSTEVSGSVVSESVVISATLEEATGYSTSSVRPLMKNPLQQARGLSQRQEGPPPRQERPPPRQKRLAPCQEKSSQRQEKPPQRQEKSPQRQGRSPQSQEKSPERQEKSPQYHERSFQRQERSSQCQERSSQRQGRPPRYHEGSFQRQKRLSQRQNGSSQHHKGSFQPSRGITQPVIVGRSLKKDDPYLTKILAELALHRPLQRRPYSSKTRDRGYSLEQSNKLKHVDFSEEECEELLRAWLTLDSPDGSQPKSDLGPKFRTELQESLQILSSAEISNFVQQLRERPDNVLQGRSSRAISAFLWDLVEGRSPNRPKFVRVELENIDPCHHPLRSTASLLRHRELGISGRRFRNSKTELQVRTSQKILPWRSWKGASGDVVACAWAPSPCSNIYAVGAAAPTNEEDLQYNRPRNLMLGNLMRNTLEELPDHRIKRPRPETISRGPNSTQAVYDACDPMVYTTVSSLRFSRDGSRLYTASHDKTVKIWDVSSTSTSCLQTLHHEALVFDLDVSSYFEDVFAAATKTIDNSIHIYFPESDEWSNPGLSSVRFDSPRAKLKRQTQLYPECLRWGRTLRTSQLLLAGFQQWGVSNDARGEGEICLWNVYAGVSLKVSPSSQSIFTATWHPTLDLFATGGSPSRSNPLTHPMSTRSVVRTWDVRCLTRYAVEYECPAIDMQDVTFNPLYPDLVTAGCTNSATYVWDFRKPDDYLHQLQHGRPLLDWDHTRPQEEGDPGVMMTVWGQESALLYTGSSDGMVKCWDIMRAPEDAHVSDIGNLGAGVQSGAFSPDFHHLLVGDSDGGVHILSSAPVDRWADDGGEGRVQAMEFIQARDAPRTVIGDDDPGTEGIRAAKELLASGRLVLDARFGVSQGSNYGGPSDGLQPFSGRGHENSAMRRTRQHLIEERRRIIAETTGEEYGGGGGSGGSGSVSVSVSVVKHESDMEELNTWRSMPSKKRRLREDDSSSPLPKKAKWAIVDLCTPPPGEVGLERRSSFVSVSSSPSSHVKVGIDDDISESEMLEENHWWPRMDEEVFKKF